MTIAVISPLARERVIEIASRQHRIRSQNRDGFHQNGTKPFSVLTAFLAFVMPVAHTRLETRAQRMMAGNYFGCFGR
jgi:hypothetical protein